MITTALIASATIMILVVDANTILVATVIIVVTAATTASLVAVVATSLATAAATSIDKIFEKVINPYLTEVLQHPQFIKMSEGMLHIRHVEGPKKTGSVETRLEAMEQQVFKCQGMVERGLNANHMMIKEFTNNQKMDAIDIGKHLSRLYDRVDQLQG
ncbi:40S ribosomal protein S5-1 [Hordeum vulgare]|nr:40S ribosomal protein S5-1 [Hordeum vulgare]